MAVVEGAGRGNWRERCAVWRVGGSWLSKSQTLCRIIILDAQQQRHQINVIQCTKWQHFHLEFCSNPRWLDTHPTSILSLSQHPLPPAHTVNGIWQLSGLGSWAEPVLSATLSAICIWPIGQCWQEVVVVAVAILAGGGRMRSHTDVGAGRREGGTHLMNYELCLWPGSLHTQLVTKLSVYLHNPNVAISCATLARKNSWNL